MQTKTYDCVITDTLTVEATEDHLLRRERILLQTLRTDRLSVVVADLHVEAMESPVSTSVR